jgi:hypothetical protein
VLPLPQPKKLWPIYKNAVLFGRADFQTPGKYHQEVASLAEAVKQGGPRKLVPLCCLDVSS